MRVLGFLLLFLLGSSLGYGDDITIATEHFPPFQIVENGKIQGGLSVEIVNKLLEETGLQAPIVAYPWARAYKMGLTDRNVMIFSMVRSEERENHFKWVGPITGSKDYYFWSLKTSSGVSINSLEDAKQFLIGVPRENYQHQFLENNGFTHLTITNDFDATLRMLYAGRIEAILGSEISITYRVDKMGFDASLLKKQYGIDQRWGELSIAFSKNTPDELVERFQQALKKIKDNGEYEQILRKWVLQEH
ncbi:transporter substrate-binding domain-containing protein [Aestuariirhabdus sp. Z084]|uniref:substrate-binding periplasmic protein n=1 Tax=Aestuariirhabdus haliotis TaxID=2918751 RepID=UPI00201B40B1|nr:transporter substrate-binding domain-containing protein [Aestuariirhabdus haliotis]MCL6416495.1 transporter substrate-binding domain-containing protein [Aestuariirhabdus haliotis]MCL6420485.1 transporter substrate-binding domain-containing protein [Aestuariirhabdus haliotis]